VPRKPTLSPTKISIYLACPFKYWWTYRDGRGRWYLKAKSYYSFGSSLHRVLERFHDLEDQGVTTTAEALAAYEESWIDAGYSSAEEMAEAFGEGRQILERHLEEIHRAPLTAKTLFVERQFRHDFGEFVLIGRIDRVDEGEDGSLEIVDYKTGRSTIDEAEVRDDLAMCCYQLLLKKKYPDREVKATILAVRTGESASYSLSSDELDEFEASLLQLGNQIIFDEYEDKFPSGKPLCLRCDFLPLCRKDHRFVEFSPAPMSQ
jgi:putative RecB family exonuclease